MLIFLLSSTEIQHKYYLTSHLMYNCRSCKRQVLVLVAKLLELKVVKKYLAFHSNKCDRLKIII